MRWNKISDAVIRRLPLYLRVLDELAEESGTESISSRNSAYGREWSGPGAQRPGLVWRVWQWG